MNDYDYEPNDTYSPPATRQGGALATTVTAPPAVAGTSQLAIQERMAKVQMRYVSARQFPRDIVRVEHGVRLACQRYGLASMAQYALPVGGSTVRGPSIRLAEVLAQSYGNLDIGKEVVATGEDKDGRYTDLRVYALDLESGTEFAEAIRVYHFRVKKKNGVVERTPLTDQSELERLFSMQAAKRLRECIYRVIPRDLTEKALAWCSETVKKGEGNKPLIERVKGMVLEFERLGVTRAQLEKRVGCTIDLWTPEHFEEMVAAYRSIRDGHATPEEFFGDANATPAGDTSARLRAQAEARQKPPAQAAEGGAK